MESLKEAIRDKRNIKENSLNAYIISLRKIHEKTGADLDFKNLNWLKNESKIMNFLNSLKLATRKNYIAAIIVALSTDNKYKTESQFYREELDKIAKQYNDNIKEQKKTETQETNWVSLAKLRKVMRYYKSQIKQKGLLKKEPGDLTSKQFELFQKWVVCVLYLLDENPPLRNDYIMQVISITDYENLKEDELLKNYLVIKSRNTKFFHLGEYKSSKKYGIKKIPVGTKLNSVLNIWLKYNKSGYLLLNSKKEPITPNGLTKFLNKTFEPTGKDNISSTMIRHIFISEKIGGPSIKEKEELADKMGHNIETQSTYKKL
tara:strand:+ start:1534 stop:2487 length:954 start_codon:yes stop_codon:yes gene_type:complete